MVSTLGEREYCARSVKSGGKEVWRNGWAEEGAESRDVLRRLWVGAEVGMPSVTGRFFDGRGVLEG